MHGKRSTWKWLAALIGVAMVGSWCPEALGQVETEQVQAEKEVRLEPLKSAPLEVLSRKHVEQKPELPEDGTSMIAKWPELIGGMTENGGATTGMVRTLREYVTIVIALAILAALAVKIPALFGLSMHQGDEAFYAHNISLFVLPFLAGYFAWKRTLGIRNCLWIAAPFAAAAVLVNVFPFEPEAATELLTILHLPIALWLVIGIAYAGGAWGDSARRMNFVRFSGEFFIYYVLIALGGIVLTALTMFMFTAIGLDPEWFMQNWLIPCGALGAVIIAAWLVETKQDIMANYGADADSPFHAAFRYRATRFYGLHVMDRE